MNKAKRRSVNPRDGKKTEIENVSHDSNKYTSSKIDRVLIELHDYSYYHGPSDLENPDNRFIGREKAIDKLKSELTDTSRKSGAYLVTGYRGMGKTSYINKVLEQLIMPFKPYSIIINLLGLILVSMLLSFLIYFISITIKTQDIHETLKLIGKIFLSLLSIFYTACTSLIVSKLFKLRKREEGSFFKSESIKAIINAIILTFTPEAVQNIKYRKNFIILSYLLTIVLSSFSFLLMPEVIQLDLRRFFYYYLTVFIAQSLFVIVLIWFDYKLIESRSGKSKKEDISKRKRRPLFEELKRFINYSDYICIKLNLGYSDLKEIDILKLIASSIKSNYNKYRKRLSFGFLVRFGLIIAIMLLANAIYNRKIFKEISSTLRNTSGITTYFPSQYEIFYSDTVHVFLRDVVRNLKEKKNSSASDYYVWTKMYEELNEKANLKPHYNFIQTYLKIADVRLFEFLSLDQIRRLNITEFDSTFQLKRNIYFELRKKVIDLRSNFSSYGLTEEEIIGTLSQDTVLTWCKKLGTPQIRIDDIYLLLSYWKENPNAINTIREADLRLEFLFPLYRIEEIRQDYEKFSSFKKRTLAFTNYIDFILSSAYYYITSTTRINLIKGYPLFFPYNLDFIYFVYLIIFLVIIKLIVSLVNIQSHSRRKIIRKINLLNEIIDAKLTIERGGNINIPQAHSSFTHKKVKTYPQDDEREIEKYIIELLDDISRLPIYSFRAQFIFVFDELDKIDPRVAPNDITAETNPGSGSDTITKRQQAVMSLLSNLKYFLSTAQAKFVFIAGRELYDAFLADISDRHFRIGSIFHDVIYINSFLSDLHPKEMEDITSRTEQFVCQFLFPKDFYFEQLNLKSYNQYLKTYVIGFGEQDGENARQKREKVIYLLQQFIIYLNHVSTGAPSKLTSYFENFIVTRESAFNQTKAGLIAGNDTPGKLYLFFDFYRQYQIGVVNYLLTPVNFSINKNIRNYSDKLIVSASFLHDHLFKFHRNAFSWRDLEATPEMIDVNKNPELRDFLGEVIHFMLDTHIQRIINGLYDFKFPKNITQEIVFLSHISQEASATFNFTLDESRATKQHFQEHYLKLKQSYQTSQKSGNEYIYSLASSILTLADICFFDEDLGQAVMYYLDSIQTIRNLKVEELTSTQLVLLVRNMLKLGHTLEKRRTFDVAYLTYHEAYLKVSEFIKKNKEQNSALLLENIRFFYQPLLSRFYLTEKTSFEGITVKDIKLTESEFNTMIAPVTKKQSRINAEVFNKIGDILYYKNKNYEAERKNTKNEEDTALSVCPLGTLKNKDKTCCSCEACKYYRKGLLSLSNEYVKTDKRFLLSMVKLIRKIKRNELEFSSLELTIIAMAFSDIGDTFMTCYNDENGFDKLLILADNKIKVSNKDAFDLSNPVDAIVMCYKAASYLYRKAGDHKSFAFQNTKLLYLIRFFLQHKKAAKPIDSTTFMQIVNGISKESINGIYSAYEHIHTYEINRFQNILTKEKKYSVSDDIYLNLISINTEIGEISILCEELEILAGIKDVDKICEEVNRIINPYTMVSSMYIRFLSLRLKSLSNMTRLKKLLQIDMSLSGYPTYISILKSYRDCFILNNINIVSEVEFLIKDSIFCNHEILKIIYTFGFSYLINHSMAAETHENLYIWCKFFSMYLKVTDYFKGNSPTAKSLAIFQDIMDSIKTSNPNIETIFKESKLKEELGNIIERDNLQFIVPAYQCEKAISEYYATLETHNQGLAYKNLIENMNYLNDDYNDRLYHFAIALERININNLNIKKKINTLKAEQINSRTKEILSYQGYII
jgi:hypothetical protein